MNGDPAPDDDPGPDAVPADPSIAAVPAVLTPDQLHPGVVVDHPGGGQLEIMLLGLNRGFRIRAEDAVDRYRVSQRSDQALKPVHHPILRLVPVAGLQLRKSDIHRNLLRSQ
jgi:hypothetical protein